MTNSFSTVLAEANPEDVETAFARVLEEFLLNSSSMDPFEVVAQFKRISATTALTTGERVSDESTVDPQLYEEFENWDLETKLWDLVETLYKFRVSSNLEVLNEYEFSSLAVKQENYLRTNPKIREIALIIDWLQHNSKSVDLPVIEGAKWGKTRGALKSNSDLEVQLRLNSNLNDISFPVQRQNELVQQLDVDAPIRTKGKIHPDDASVDEQNFYSIYKLLLVNKTSEAIEVANSTGNYALALILIGATQEYTDPIIDKLEGLQDEALTASGIKHKLLWKKTVYNLSQQKSLSPSERMIYSFLSGGDLSTNIKEASDNWEECLLLYLYQMYSYALEKFIVENGPHKSTVSAPRPQFDTVEGVLNSLSHKGGETTTGGAHPLRVISGGVMIDKVSALLHNIISSLNEEVIKPYLARVVTHLSIFGLLIGGDQSISPLDVTTIITLYISRLSDYNLTSLIPIYISFIPNEEDAREIYSLFLSTITEASQRRSQIEIFRKLANPLTSDDDLVMIDDSYSSKMTNVLRRTVERVIVETESHYIPENTIKVQDALPGTDEVDFRLYSSVEWFYDNDMYEDAILATLTIIRRFLLNGKITSLKAFTADKNFKKLIRDNDADLHTKMLTDSSYQTQITEENKQELLEYAQLVEGLNLITDWKEFLTTHKYNGLANRSPLWETSGVSKSVEKTTDGLHRLIFSWLQELISSKSKEDGHQGSAIFIELRTTYVPFLIIELLQIYQSARLKNWSYIKQAFALINDIADESQNDFLSCFIRCGRLDEFLIKAGEISIIAAESGISGVFPSV